MFFVLSSVEAWGFVRSFVGFSFVGSFVPSLRSRCCFVGTVVLSVDNYRECSWRPWLLRKITLYECFRYVATRVPRYFIVAALNVEFERSVRILSVFQYFFDDVRRSFRVLLLTSVASSFGAVEFSGGRAYVTRSALMRSMAPSRSNVGPIIFS